MSLALLEIHRRSNNVHAMAASIKQFLQLDKTRHFLPAPAADDRRGEQPGNSSDSIPHLQPMLASSGTSWRWSSSGKRRLIKGNSGHTWSDMKARSGSLTIGVRVPEWSESGQMTPIQSQHAARRDLRLTVIIHEHSDTLALGKLKELWQVRQQAWMLHLEGIIQSSARTEDTLPALRARQKGVAACAKLQFGGTLCGISNVPVPEHYQRFHCPARSLEKSGSANCRPLCLAATILQVLVTFANR